MNDIPRQTLSGPDMSGHLSGHDRVHKSEPLFALDLYQVASLFDATGLSRNRRSLARYCSVNKLDAEKVETLTGEEWRVDEQSVHRLIAQIKEQQRLTGQDTSRQDPPGHPSEMPVNPGPSMPGHDQTRPDMSGSDFPVEPLPINTDQPGQSETGHDLSEPVIAQADERLLMQLERENDLLRDQLGKKDNQIENKDKQIDDLIERGREDKLLIQNFQRKLGMLEAPEQDRPQHQDQTPLPWQRPSVDNSQSNSGEWML